MSLKNFFQEVHRRSIWQVLAVYGVAAWVVLQVVQTLTESLGLPLWFPAFALLLLLIGLPIILATAIIQGGGPSLRRVDPTLLPSAEAGGPAAEIGEMRPRLAGPGRLLTWRNALAGGVLALALWGIIAAGYLLLAGGGRSSGAPGSPESGRKMLVVLPFENLSDEADDYFAAGITDAITARLAGLGGLGITSRQSAVQYRDSELSAQEIGNELGVEYILEGTVQRERPGDPESRVRVIPQLVRTSDDTHLWAATYDEDMAEVFRVQSEIAERVAQALDVTLLEPEQRSLDAKPTENLEAYDYHLRGNDYMTRGQLAYIERAPVTAVDMYERAVELDPRFALAWAALSRAHTLVYDYGFDVGDDRLQAARSTAERAAQLDPDLPEAHFALGAHYATKRLFDDALQQFEIARRAQPRNADLLRAIGAVLNQQGRHDEAISVYREAVDSDPRSASAAVGLGLGFYYAGRASEAESEFSRAITLAPDQILPYAYKIQLYVRTLGDLDKAHDVVTEGSERMGRLLFAANLLSQDPAYFASLGDEFAATLDELSIESFGHDTVSHFFYFNAKGALYMRRAQPETARAYYDSARVVLERYYRRAAEFPEWMRWLAVSYAGLGRTDEAIRTGKRALELVPPSKDALLGSFNIRLLAMIYMMVGDYAAAVEQLESLLTVAPRYTRAWLRTDPTWDPLRDDPLFQALLDADS